MNPTTRIVSTFGIAIFISAAASQAQSWSDNLYLHTDIGPAFIEDTPTRVHSVTLSNLPFGTTQRGHFEAETDIRADLSLGYNLTKSFGIEVESGFIWNPTDDSNNYFYQIPVMLNGIYQIPLGDSWKAYVGAGAGAVISKTHFLFRNPAFHTRLVYEDSDWSPGYQAEVGIKYALSRHMDIDLGYKFLGIAGYEYQLGTVESTFMDVKINDLFIHSAQLSLTWKF